MTEAKFKWCRKSGRFNPTHNMAERLAINPGLV